MLQAARAIAAAAVAIAAAISSPPARAQVSTNTPTSAPLFTDSASRGGAFITASVFRVICPEKGVYGSGFLHKSGLVITAEHVIDGCAKIEIALPNNTLVPANITKSDDRLDLAILKPETPIPGVPLPISAAKTLNVGNQVGIWGFPAGYNGVAPMLSVGYFSGVDGVQTKNGQVIGQMVLNAAVNHGDSGGPVILVETGEVIGVADNKIVPLSQNAVMAIAALQNQSSGFVYTATLADGAKKNFSEGQVVAMVLEELRQQVQLVVGHAVFGGDLRSFLTENGIDP